MTTTNETATATAAANNETLETETLAIPTSETPNPETETKTEETPTSETKETEEKAEKAKPLNLTHVIDYEAKTVTIQEQDKPELQIVFSIDKLVTLGRYCFKSYKAIANSKGLTGTIQFETLKKEPVAGKVVKAVNEAVSNAKTKLIETLKEQGKTEQEIADFVAMVFPA